VQIVVENVNLMEYMKPSPSITVFRTVPISKLKWSRYRPGVAQRVTGS